MYFCKYLIRSLLICLSDQGLFIPRHTIVGGYYGITLAVGVSIHPSVVRPSVFSFPTIT